MALDDNFLNRVDDIECLMNILLTALNTHKDKRDSEEFGNYYNHIKERFCIYQVEHYEILGVYYRLDQLDE